MCSINAHKLHHRLIIYLINWFWLNNERGHEELYNFMQKKGTDELICYGRIIMKCVYVLKLKLQVNVQEKTPNRSNAQIITCDISELE